MSPEEEMMALAVRAITSEFDDFIGHCTDESGNPKAPTRQDIAKARGFLPFWCTHAYKKVEK